MNIERAHEIMGDNFFGLNDWMQYVYIPFNLPIVLPSEERFLEYSEFPWEEDVLNAPCPFNPDKKIRETHFAFLGIEHLHPAIPLTILQWDALLCQMTGGRQLVEYSISRIPDVHLEVPSITMDACNFRWYFMPLMGLWVDRERAFQEQLKELPSEYEVPSIVEEMHKSLLYFLKHQAYPCEIGHFLHICRDRIDVTGERSYWLGVLGMDYYHRKVDIVSVLEQQIKERAVSMITRIAVSRKLPLYLDIGFDSSVVRKANCEWIKVSSLMQYIQQIIPDMTLEKLWNRFVVYWYEGDDPKLKGGQAWTINFQDVHFTKPDLSQDFYVSISWAKLMVQFFELKLHE